MSFRLHIHGEAHEDIHRNSLWWAKNHSLDQAITWEIAVYDQLAGLASLPERKPLAVENPSFPFDVREALIGLGSRPRYRAIFTIRDNVVHILAFLDSAQDKIRPGDLKNPGDENR